MSMRAVVPSCLWLLLLLWCSITSHLVCALPSVFPGSFDMCDRDVDCPLLPACRAFSNASLFFPGQFISTHAFWLPYLYHCPSDNPFYISEYFFFAQSGACLLLFEDVIVVVDDEWMMMLLILLLMMNG